MEQLFGEVDFFSFSFIFLRHHVEVEVVQRHFRTGPWDSFRDLQRQLSSVEGRKVQPGLARADCAWANAPSALSAHAKQN